MISFDTRASRIKEVERVMRKLDTKSESRVLSAMGHPGYSDSFARAALQRWVRGDVSLHLVVYGGMK